MALLGLQTEALSRTSSRAPAMATQERSANRAGRRECTPDLRLVYSSSALRVQPVTQEPQRPCLHMDGAAWHAVYLFVTTKDDACVSRLRGGRGVSGSRSPLSLSEFVLCRCKFRRPNPRPNLISRAPCGGSSVHHVPQPRSVSPTACGAERANTQGQAPATVPAWLMTPRAGSRSASAPKGSACACPLPKMRRPCTNCSRTGGHARLAREVSAQASLRNAGAFQCSTLRSLAERRR
jgi:hypothetical protein